MLEIRNIISEYDSIDHTSVKVALASVVNVQQSAYRRIGARMLVQSNGMWLGGISGGCLEGDALKKSQNAIFKNEPSIVVYDTTEDDELQIGVGLGCKGRVEVLITPIDPNDPNNEIELLRSILRNEQPSILAKVISKDSPHLAKCKILNQENQLFDIPVIKMENAISKTKEKKSPQLFYFKTEENEFSILLEFVRPETRLIIVGDNYDVHAMTNIAKTLGWEVWIVGRIKKLSKQLANKVEKIIPFEEYNKIKIHEYSAIILMSHDYKWDKTILQHVTKLKPSYLGILGPKTRFKKMIYELNMPELESTNFIHSPTGLEIGAESPEEISLSIAAEILAIFREKKGTFLKLKEGSIHPRT